MYWGHGDRSPNEPFNGLQDFSPWACAVSAATILRKSLG